MEVEARKTVRGDVDNGRVVVRHCEVADVAAWEAFVNRCPDTTFFHRIGWRDIIEQVFRHRTHYRIAERRGDIVGILPLAEINSRLFGHALVSLPFGVSGGPAAAESDAGRALRHSATPIGRALA